MRTQIKKIGMANGIRPSGNVYSLSEMIQESYTAYYKAKKGGNKLTIKLAEGHLNNVKKNPSDLKPLCEDLDVLKDIVKLGNDVKDMKEVPASNKVARSGFSKLDNAENANPDTVAKRNAKKPYSRPWNSEKLTTEFNSFRESAKDKVFMKELGKFNRSIAGKKPITLAESMNLYKASNSCLTHLTIELNRNPSFKSTFTECTKILAYDNYKLLESIRNSKTPSADLLESFTTFSNILLECDTKFDKDFYTADDTDPEDPNKFKESCGSSKKSLKEDEEIPSEGSEVDTDSEVPAENDTDTVIDITEDELNVLKSVLSKLSPTMKESDDTIPDEEHTDDEDDTETSDEDVPADEEPDEDIPDAIDDIPDEELLKDDEDLEEGSDEDEDPEIVPPDEPTEDAPEDDDTEEDPDKDDKLDEGTDEDDPAEDANPEEELPPDEDSDDDDKLDEDTDPSELSTEDPDLLDDPNIEVDEELPDPDVDLNDTDSIDEDDVEDLKRRSRDARRRSAPPADPTPDDYTLSESAKRRIKNCF